MELISRSTVEFGSYDVVSLFRFDSITGRRTGLPDLRFLAQREVARALHQIPQKQIIGTLLGLAGHNLSPVQRQSLHSPYVVVKGRRTPCGVASSILLLRERHLSNAFVAVKASQIRFHNMSQC
jgi:hypothetical protein